MKKNIKPSEITRLDNILKHLAAIQQPNSFREFYELKTELEKIELNYDEFDLWSIMDKLYKDGFVSTEEKYINDIYQDISGEFKVNQRLNHRFYITLDGRMFINSGGYHQKDNDIKSIRFLRYLEKGLLVFGAVSAGIYSLYQLFLNCCTN